MKKTITCALCAALMSATAFADEFTKTIVYPTQTAQFLGGTSGQYNHNVFQNVTDSTAEYLVKVMTYTNTSSSGSISFPMDTLKVNGAGVYWNVSNGNNVGVNDYTKTDTGFNFIGRSANGGEFVMICLGASYLAQEGGDLTSLSVTGSTNNNSIVFSAWLFDSSNNTASVLKSPAAGTSFDSGKMDVSTLTADQFVVLVWGSAASGGTSLSVTDLAMKATYTGTAPSPAVPEPATATLSLLALAGLCARRRRK